MGCSKGGGKGGGKAGGKGARVKVAESKLGKGARPAPTR